MTAEAATATAADMAGGAESPRRRSLLGMAFRGGHKVALAGIGVIGVAADTGNSVFNRLVERGARIEDRGKESVGGLREMATERMLRVRDAAGRSFENTRERARAGIEGELERRLDSLGVPGKADLAAVVERLIAIEQRLAALEQPAKRRSTTKKAPAKSAVAAE